MSGLIRRFSAVLLLSTALAAGAKEGDSLPPGEVAMGFLEMYAKPETQAAAGPALGIWILKELEAGDAQSALATLRPIQEKRPEDVQVMTLTGMVLNHMERFKEAEPLLEKAIGAGGDGRAFEMLVYAKMQLGKWDWCEANKQRMDDQLAANPIMLLSFAHWAAATRNPAILNDAMPRLSPAQIASLDADSKTTLKKTQDFLAAIDEAPAPKPDAEGFVSIFDGTLKNWDGDPVYWRSENGVLIGEVKPETLLKQNSFIVWRGGEVGDFELKGEYRVSAEGNSGINYRSIDVPGTKWAMQGYQDDIDGKDAWSGQNYEERGRTFLAYRGQSAVVHPDGKPEVTKDLGDRAELQQKVRKEDWNEVHIVARGNLMQHFTNGVLMAEVLDEDPNGRRMSGLLGVQVHVGPPMKIEFRNLRVKTLSPVPVDGYRTVTIGSGMQLDLPLDWISIRGDNVTEVAKMEVKGPIEPLEPGAHGKTQWLAAGHRRQDGAQVSLTVQTAPVPSKLTQGRLAVVTPVDLAEIRKSYQSQVDGAKPPLQNGELSNFKVVPVSGLWGLQYRCESPAGPAPGSVPTSMNELQMIMGGETTQFVFSVATSERARWQPVYDHIVRSIRFPEKK